MFFYGTVQIICCEGYRGSSPTAFQAWRPCLLWEPSPIVTPYQCRLEDLLCFCVSMRLLHFCVICELFFLQYFDTVGWARITTSVPGKDFDGSNPPLNPMADTQSPKLFDTSDLHALTDIPRTTTFGMMSEARRHSYPNFCNLCFQDRFQDKKVGGAKAGSAHVGKRHICLQKSLFFVQSPTRRTGPACFNTQTADLELHFSKMIHRATCLSPIQSKSLNFSPNHNPQLAHPVLYSLRSRLRSQLDYKFYRASRPHTIPFKGGPINEQLSGICPLLRLFWTRG